jgi:hypothetical protein
VRVRVYQFHGFPRMKRQNSTAIPIRPTIQAIQYMILSARLLGSRPPTFGCYTNAS